MFLGMQDFILSKPNRILPNLPKFYPNFYKISQLYTNLPKKIPKFIEVFSIFAQILSKNTCL